MKTIRENIDAMKNMVSKMPKTVNEAMDFEGDVPMTYDEPVEAEPIVEPEPVAEPEPVQPATDNALRGKDLINDIRKKALCAMAEMADTPEDESYITLKKVWQICDKTPNEKPVPEA